MIICNGDEARGYLMNAAIANSVILESAFTQL